MAENWRTPILRHGNPEQGEAGHGGELESDAPNATRLRGGLRMDAGRRQELRPGRRTSPFRSLLSRRRAPRPAAIRLTDEHDVAGAKLEVRIAVLHRLVVV